MATFAGGVFSDALPGGRAGATLSVSGSLLSAETASGERFELRAGESELDLGGASGRMWFVRDRAGVLTLYSEAPGFEAALASSAGFRDPVEHLLAQRRRGRRRGLALWVAGLTVLAVLSFAGWRGLRSAGRAALMALPTSVDEKLGKLAMSSMDLEGEVVDDEVVVDAIEQIVVRLAEHAHGSFDYEVQVVDADIVNAFALPGGQIVVYTGLIREAETIDAVAGVMAHEIAHVTERHGIQRIGQALGIAAAVQVLIGDVGGLSALVIDLVQQGALTSYGRDSEREADREGVRMLRAAGLDPRGLIQIFERFAEDQGELETSLAWLSSHPEPGERIETIRGLLGQGESTPLRPLQVDFADVRERLGFDDLRDSDDPNAEADPDRKADPDAKASRSRSGEIAPENDTVEEDRDAG